MPARFSGHETFACRYAWLPKALQAIQEDRLIFTDEDRAMVELGVGKNMVRSIRFWVEASGMAEPAEGGGLRPSWLGDLIFGANGLDPYMEDIQTLWLIHWNLATHVEDPLFAWQFLFGRWQEPEFTESGVLKAFMREAETHKRLSEVTVQQHLQVFLHTYVPTRGKKGEIAEDNLDCPLTELEIVVKVGEREGIGVIRSVGSHLEDFLETRPLVARRHYIKTGNLRYFDVRYVRADQLKELADVQTKADGVVAIALCETKSDCDRAEQIALSSHFHTRKELLVAIPMEPLAHQTGLLLEVLRWDWVGLNTPELHSDRFASEEVSRQRRAARNRLSSRIQDLIGLQSLNGARALRWFSLGKVQKIASSRDLLDRLSSICDDLYHQAPFVKNELLNRQSLSSAAAAARMRLIEGILEKADKPLLGMDPKKKPPEMSMYLSVFQRGGLHIETPDGWRLTLPNAENDALRLLPCLQGIGSYIERRPSSASSSSSLLGSLSVAMPM